MKHEDIEHCIGYETKHAPWSQVNEASHISSCLHHDSCVERALFTDFVEGAIMFSLALITWMSLKQLVGRLSDRIDRLHDRPVRRASLTVYIPDAHAGRAAHQPAGRSCADGRGHQAEGGASVIGYVQGFPHIRGLPRPQSLRLG